MFEGLAERLMMRRGERQLAADYIDGARCAQAGARLPRAESIRSA